MFSDPNSGNVSLELLWIPSPAYCSIALLLKYCRMKFCRSPQPSWVKASVEKQNAERSTGTRRRLKGAQASCPGCQKCPLSRDTNLIYDVQSFCTPEHMEKNGFTEPGLKTWLPNLTDLRNEVYIGAFVWSLPSESFSRDRNLSAGLLQFLSFLLLCFRREKKRNYKKLFLLTRLRELIFAALHAGDLQIKQQRYSHV